MSNLINNYPVFESSQVLTSSQLNRITSYLDQQNRLTRTHLIGMGIVCGLELSTDDSGGDLTITISRGTAITSEGFLVYLNDCETSFVRPYKLPNGVTYAPFDNTDPSITLYELLAQEPDDMSNVASLSDDPSFLDDKFVLLFLEIFDNDLKACLGNTCDDLGIDRIFTIRKLLISKTDLDELLEHSSNVGYYYDEKYDLPDLAMPRTLFDPDSAHSADYGEFTSNYADSATSLFSKLFGAGATHGALHETYTAFNTLLADLYGFENPMERQAIVDRVDEWKEYLEDAVDTSMETHGIQYFNGFLNDLVLAYNEFRDVAFRLASECCPDMSRFPRHVMLGRAAVENETPEESITYRHGFTQPPVYNHQKKLIKESISLHKRILFMLHSFDLDLIRTPLEDTERDILITPSDENKGKLSSRSIPYYYDLDTALSYLDGTLEQVWNFHSTQQTRAGNIPATLSYYNQSEDQSEPLTPTETPLYYSLEQYPFLRIEGHLGQQVEAVISRIEELRKQFDLPFDLRSLQLDASGDLLEIDYSCGFEDLQERYRSARRTYCNFIKDLIELLMFVSQHQDVLFDSSDEIDADLQEIKIILGTLKSVCTTLTECLDEFDILAFQTQYKDSLAQILDFILIRKELLNSIDVNEDDAEKSLPVINGLLAHMSPLIYRFVDILFYNTFLQIYEAFKRREHYLQKETAVFSNYIKAHPGVSHQAGVPKGGTFIVVYASDEMPRVVADFSLPYTCCGTDRCVPMCDDEDFTPEIPPFARPDFAVTTIETPIEIDVVRNDFSTDTENIFIIEVQEETEGGNITILEDKNVLKYSPKSEFTGVDQFRYRILNRSTNLDDEGSVTVLVKEADNNQVESCYPASVLVCWANGKREKIVNFYNRRHPNNPIDADIPTVAAALHESLKASGGFTNDELDSMEPMEDTNQRRLMISCIDSDVLVDSMKWDELGNWIRQYQKDNCGEELEETVNECYSVSILDCWSGGDLAMLTEFYNRNNPNNMISGGSAEKVYRAVLDFLQRTGGFDEKELSNGILEDDNRKRQLLNCLQLPFNENMTSAQLTSMILSYQHNNCNDGQTDNVVAVTVEMKPGELSAKEIVAVLRSRGVQPSGNASSEKLLSSLRNTGSGLRLSEDELMLFTKGKLMNVMKERGIDVSSGSTKNSLAKKFLRGS